MKNIFSFFKSKKIPDKLHICLVTRKSPLPGNENDDSYLWPIAYGLAQRGHEVVVLSWKNKSGRAVVTIGNVKIYFLGEDKKKSESTPFMNLVYNKFQELHSVKPFHIVHSLDNSAKLIGAERKNLGVIVTYDVSATQMAQIFSILGMAQETLGGLLSTGVALFYKFMTTFLSTDRPLLLSADGVIVSTPLQKIMLERYYLYPDFKTFIVPYGLDYIETELKSPSVALREKLNIPLHARVILTFTDMSEFAEVANLLRAFQKVVIKKPNARLIIMGNGPLKNEIEFEMLNLALGSKVIFTGSVASEDIMDYISISDLYVNLSSRTTGFETTMLESMAQKKVVVGSELSPIATIVDDGADGFLIRPADITTLTDLITALFGDEFKSNKTDRTSSEIGLHAREKVLDLFNVDKMVDQVLIAFNKIILRTSR
jgi:glycosyltransferase involved in cell wall biosynthesis